MLPPAAIGWAPPTRARVGRSQTGQLMIINCTWFVVKESKCWSAKDTGVIMASINCGLEDGAAALGGWGGIIAA